MIQRCLNCRNLLALRKLRIQARNFSLSGCRDYPQPAAKYVYSDRYASPYKKFNIDKILYENDIVGVRDVNTMLRLVLIVWLGSHFIWFLRMYMLCDTWIQNDELELQDAERQKEAIRQLLSSDA